MNMANDENQIDVPSDEQSGKYFASRYFCMEQKRRMNTLKKQE